MKFSKKKIIKDTLIYTILPKISVFAHLLVMPIISPYLSLNDYGIYGLLVAYLSVWQILITLGQNIVLQNSFFEQRDNYAPTWRSSFGLMILGGVICSLIFTAIIYFTMLDKIGSNWIWVCLMMGFNLILCPIETIAVNYYVLHEKSFPYAICSTIVGCIAVLLNLITIKYLKLGFLGWIIVLPVSTLIMYLYYAKRLFIEEKLYPSFRLKYTVIKESLKVGLPLVPHQLSLYMLGTSNRLLLEYSKTPLAQIGYYSQGYNMAAYSNVLISGIFQSLSRQLQEGFRSETESARVLIRKLIISVTLLITGTLFIACLWMKEAFLFLFRNPELQKAYPATIIIMSAYMYWSVYSFFVYPLSIKKQTFAISKISMLAAAVNLVISIILIPYLGVMAALIATYVSYVIFGFAGLLNKENRDLFNKYLNITKFCLVMLAINAIAFLVAYYLMDTAIFSKIVITSALLIGILIVYVVYRKGLTGKFRNKLNI
ncbi:oligosaccharide flippase family protein [Chitinophaga niabensis]|uniref:Membrane protein involved in the export of O-antigen and teichoic acid n=1 Tax=Chitinophaga niabensis TaxID=536979 RepID=A0A1N6JYG2_9BACT|nr:oligosaccharide flippase family protein [Chitinophaga niabensis]SIO49086.1 Membrane protein involved in the export of O-antigen and teichoic acid [Chitinophaga niabensis]